MSSIEPSSSSRKRSTLREDSVCESVDSSMMDSPPAKRQQGNALDYLFIGTINHNGEWDRDPTKDTRTTIGWQASTHTLSSRDFANLLANPAVKRIMEEFKGRDIQALFKCKNGFVRLGDISRNFKVVAFAMEDFSKPEVIIHWANNKKTKGDYEEEEKRKGKRKSARVGQAEDTADETIDNAEESNDVATLTRIVKELVRENKAIKEELESVKKTAAEDVTFLKQENTSLKKEIYRKIKTVKEDLRGEIEDVKDYGTIQRHCNSNYHEDLVRKCRFRLDAIERKMKQESKHPESRVSDVPSSSSSQQNTSRSS